MGSLAETDSRRVDHNILETSDQRKRTNRGQDMEDLSTIAVTNYQQQAITHPKLKKSPTLFVNISG